MERRHACGMGVAFYARKFVMQMAQDCIWHQGEHLRQFLYVHSDLIPSPNTQKSIAIINNGCACVPFSYILQYSTSHIHILHWWCLY